MADEIARQRAVMKVLVINLFVKSPKNQLYFIAQSLLIKAENVSLLYLCMPQKRGIPLYPR